MAPRFSDGSDDGSGNDSGIPGLPDDWRPEHIPRPSELALAAGRLIDNALAFVLVHQEDPQAVAGHLDYILEIVRVVAHTPGEHQKQAVELALSLGRNVWHSAGRIDEWPRFVMSLYTTVRELDDMELMVALYRRWSDAAYLAINTESFQSAFNSALEYAQATGDPQLQLIVRVEELGLARNLKRRDMVEQEAAALLAEARELGNLYVQARLYMTLAGLYNSHSRRQDTFEAAQQAYACYSQLDCLIPMASALHYMILSLQANPDHSRDYVRFLMERLERLATRLGDPWLLVGFWHNAGVSEYHAHRYETARQYVLNAVVCARGAAWHPAEAPLGHMLGMIQMQRHRWHLAERHFARANRLYRAAGDEIGRLKSRHAAAYMYVVKKDFVTAERALQAVYDEVERHPPDQVADLLASIAEDLEYVRRALGRSANSAC